MAKHNHCKTQTLLSCFTC